LFVDLILYWKVSVLVIRFPGSGFELYPTDVQDDSAGRFFSQPVPDPVFPVTVKAVGDPPGQIVCEELEIVPPLIDADSTVTLLKAVPHEHDHVI
jgi:hypothetical protein